MSNHNLNIIIFLLLSCFIVETLDSILFLQKIEQNALDCEQEGGDDKTDKEDKEEKKEKTNEENVNAFLPSLSSVINLSIKRNNKPLVNECVHPTYHIIIFSPPPEAYI